MSEIDDLRRRVQRLEYQIAQNQMSTADYSISWTAATADPALVDGTLIARYCLRGRMCLVNISLTIGASTTLGTGAWRFSLPFQIRNDGRIYVGVAHLRDAATNNYERLVLGAPAVSAVDLRSFPQLDNGTNVNTLDSTTPWSWGTGDSMNIQIEYEIA